MESGDKLIGKKALRVLRDRAENAWGCPVEVFGNGLEVETCDASTHGSLLGVRWVDRYKAPRSVERRHVWVPSVDGQDLHWQKELNSALGAAKIFAANSSCKFGGLKSLATTGTVIAKTESPEVDNV